MITGFGAPLASRASAENDVVAAREEVLQVRAGARHRHLDAGRPALEESKSDAKVPDGLGDPLLVVALLAQEDMDVEAPVPRRVSLPPAALRDTREQASLLGARSQRAEEGVDRLQVPAVDGAQRVAQLGEARWVREA